MRIVLWLFACSLAVLPAAAKAETITIAYNEAWAPYSSGSESSVNGVVVRLVEEIIDRRLGWRVENVGLPWARVQLAVERGEVDAMVTFASDERKAYAWAAEQAVFTIETKAHVVRGSPAAKALREDPSIENHRQFTHCAILADAWASKYLEDNGIPFETTRDTSSCLRQLAAGHVDVYLHAVDSVAEEVASQGLEDKIEVLPEVYSSIPLTLLLSKKSSISAAFAGAFDDAVLAMRGDGSYAQLLEEIRLTPAGVVVTTLDWPPYTGADLPGGGAVTEVVRQAFARSGIETSVIYVPWKRAIAYAKDAKSGAVGFFPGYNCDQQPGLLASEPIGEGPLALAERRDADVSWESLNDLIPLRVGTVVGYANTEEFDQWVNNGQLSVISSISDTENLLKLAEGKLDLAVVDRYVFEHLMRTEKRLIHHADMLRIDDKPLESKKLYLCLRAGPRGENLRNLFDAGLRSVDFDGIWQATLAEVQ
ncbi:MAG: transporter substrate-binding domain-containing protein [Rhodospirillales bacterium]